MIPTLSARPWKGHQQPRDGQRHELGANAALHHADLLLQISRIDETVGAERDRDQNLQSVPIPKEQLRAISQLCTLTLREVTDGYWLWDRYIDGCKIAANSPKTWLLKRDKS